MTKHLRHLARSLAAGVFICALAGCGGHGSDASAAPRDASMESFCAVVKSLSSSSDPQKLVEALRHTGTPKGISDDARAGFEILIDKADDDSISDAQKASVSAFVEYATSSCA